ncbi:hypothetical protein DB44_CK00110 [Candidatus Protochlamydia amoebophila]|uniref:Uncharacterized protein n=1 Tax=Candidatus Protochlamydia amoebophila TaxID=362787 RepID=A0A0C1HC13_9BACT|nr:hypothetical protein DB44_CK00110 [Candidatus Protochlamydia amoebophila]
MFNGNLNIFFLNKTQVIALNRYRHIFFLIGCFLFLTSCGPKSLEDYKEEGKGITRSLIQELREIRNRDQLLASTSLLQKRFDQLVFVMIGAREFQYKYPNMESHELTLADHELSDKLRIELNRIYHIEGAKQIIEKCQEMALNRLDACEKKLSK